MILRDLLLIRGSSWAIQALSKRNLANTSKKPRRQGSHNRLWSIPGESVLRKEILAKQYAMKWHPGLNAGISLNRSIYALCDGVMVITEEKYEPDWDHLVVSNAYQNKDGKFAPTHARYIHVIPKKRVSEFKLIDEV